jgi:hypothetical protein
MPVTVSFRIKQRPLEFQFLSREFLSIICIFCSKDKYFFYLCLTDTCQAFSEFKLGFKKLCKANRMTLSPKGIKKKNRNNIKNDNNKN